MSWNKNILGEVTDGLRNFAQNGQFVPFNWIESIDGPDDTCTARGCGWGIVGWLVAMAVGGPTFAKLMMPVGSTQRHVNFVLRSAGLTHDDIVKLTPQAVWGRFDEELYEAYEKRLDGSKAWDIYIQKSMILAEFFVNVLRRVPVAEVTIIETSNPALRSPLLLDDDPVLPDVADLGSGANKLLLAA